MYRASPLIRFAPGEGAAMYLETVFEPGPAALVDESDHFAAARGVQKIRPPAP